MPSNDDVLFGWWGYMRRRNWAQSTRLRRLCEARWYIEAVGDWRGATWRDVEHYLDRRDVGPSTARDIVSNLRAFYRWAGREGYCEQDPTALVDNPRVPRRMPRPAHDDDIALALESADDRMAAMIALMAGCGLRCCEVAALRWDDIDLATAMARVIGKGDRERPIWLSPDVVGRLVVLETSAPGPVFMNRFGQPCSKAVVSVAVNGHFRRLGLTARAHRLRHWHGTDGLARTGNLAITRDMLGHATTATTELYAKLVPGAAADAQRATVLPSLAAS